MNKNETMLDRIAAVIVDDILDMDDNEIIEETAESGLDPHEEAQRIRRLIFPLE